MLFTEAKRYYVQRRISDRMAFLEHRVLRHLFRLPARRCRRRDREVHQRLHRQRDLFLPRGPSAALPVVRSAERARAGQAAGRGAAHLVGARAPPARSPIRSPSGCSRTGPRSTSRTSRSSAPTSTPSASTAARQGEFGERALMRLSPRARREILRCRSRTTAGASSPTCASRCSSPRSTSWIRRKPAGMAYSMSSSAETC